MHFPVTSPFQIISSYSRPSSKEMHSSIPPSHIHGMLHHCAMLSWELPKLQAPSWSSRRGQRWAKSLPHCNAVTKNVAGREIILKRTSTVRRNLDSVCFVHPGREHRTSQEWYGVYVVLSGDDQNEKWPEGMEGLKYLCHAMNYPCILPYIPSVYNLLISWI